MLSPTPVLYNNNNIFIKRIAVTKCSKTTPRIWISNTWSWRSPTAWWRSSIARWTFWSASCSRRNCPICSRFASPMKFCKCENNGSKCVKLCCCCCCCLVLTIHTSKKAVSNCFCCCGSTTPPLLCRFFFLWQSVVLWKIRGSWCESNSKRSCDVVKIN